MPVEPLVNLDEIDLTNTEFSADEIGKVNPQSFEMRQLDGIIKIDADTSIIVGYKEVRDDEFWVRGHIPGRPLLPGVLMIEAAAQLCSFYLRKLRPESKFMGFAGLENVKFRGQVVPGDRLILIAKCVRFRSRGGRFDTQGIVKGEVVFEAHIIGITM